MSLDLNSKILQELEMLRKLKMVELAERGYSQSRLGEILGISQSTVSKMMNTKQKPPKAKGDE